MNTVAISKPQYCTAGSLRGVMGKVVAWAWFELQSDCFVRFQTNTPGKDMSSIIRHLSVDVGWLDFMAHQPL